MGDHSRILEIEKWHTRRDPAQAWEVHACCSISYCIYAPIRLFSALGATLCLQQYVKSLCLHVLLSGHIFLGVMQVGMLITLSIIGGLAGVTGAASLTKFFCETFGKGITLKPPGRFRLEHRDSLDIPEGLADDAQLIRGLLDDAEITLRGLRRERPGPSRRCGYIQRAVASSA